MKIAVLMSTYNGHTFLNQQLASLEAQTVAKNMTVYVRDDGSSDDTFDIIEKWKKKINIVLYKGKNIGPAMSFWNLLMNPEIQADYYAFCDQDDVWDADKLECGIIRLIDDTHFYACNCRIIDENGNVVKEKRTDKAPEISNKTLFVSGCTQGCSMIFTDKLKQYIVGLNLQCIPMHDVIVMLYALHFGKIYWDQTPRFGYRVHSNNVVSKGNKTMLQKIKTTYWNWKNGSKNSMADVAGEILDNVKCLSSYDEAVIKAVKNYKKNPIKLVRTIGNIDVTKSARRSFYLRVFGKLY